MCVVTPEEKTFTSVSFHRWQRWQNLNRKSSLWTWKATALQQRYAQGHTLESWEKEEEVRTRAFNHMCDQRVVFNLHQQDIVNFFIYSKPISGIQTDRCKHRAQTVRLHGFSFSLLTVIRICYLTVSSTLSKPFFPGISMQICIKQNACIYIKNVKASQKYKSTTIKFHLH